MQYSLIVVLALAASSSAFSFRGLGDGGKVKINYIVDMQLKYYVDVLLNSTYPLPDFSGPDGTLVGVSVSGVNTMVRKGDNFVTIDGPTSTLTSEGSFGLKAMVLHVDKFTMGGKTGKTDIHVGDNTLSFSVTTTVTSTSCTAAINSAVVSGVSGVTLSSDNPDLDGKDITQLCQDKVVPFINQQLTTDAMKQKIYQLINPCLDRF